ncbi:MAG: CBASS oligonucleotide cyclase [Chloroflexi bacterium]|nr:CBASS oligonucleotide cyclase [Chloroflexota bacterium]
MAGSSPRRLSSVRPPLPEAEINEYLRQRLRDYNDRDVASIARHIDVLRKALESEFDELVRPLFGGSVGRHTYVDGLSDIDVLMVIEGSALSEQSPSDALQRMARSIRERLPSTTVSVGSMAVTIQYSDRHEVQVLPSIKSRTGIRIPMPGGAGWSRILHPERFARKLTNVNQSNGGRVVPTIKLVKTLARRSVQSDRGRLSGYHIESLAIDAFQSYQGPRDLQSMLRRFLTHAASAVLQPIRDSTGQSRFVDGYLGSAGSTERRRAAENLRRMRRSLDACRSHRDLDNLFRQ